MSRLIKGREKRKADHPIDSLFLDRWSPRAMSGEEIRLEELNILFEAARWAPSSYNNQPWRILFARRGTEYWPVFFDLLVNETVFEGPFRPTNTQDECLTLLVRDD